MDLVQNDHLIHFLQLESFKFLSDPFIFISVLSKQGLIITKYVNSLGLFGCLLSAVSGG